MSANATPSALCPNYEILLPSANVDLKKWAVIACDQFTAQPEYWAEADQQVGTSPSTLRIIYPEVYLNEPEEAKAKRISGIQSTMQQYLSSGVLAKKEWPVLVERSVLGRVHMGLVVAIDLEAYQFGKGAVSCMIRPTEETIVERLPPRIRIRKGAALEAPHILLLLDDPKCSVLEPLTAKARANALGAPLYETDLMLEGGHVRGWSVQGEERKRVMAAIAALATKEAQVEKYGDKAGAVPLLFAVGDGNHSLATAKAVWEEQKKAGADPKTAPGRYALVELCNVHDPELIFEPIHRVLLETKPEEVLASLKEKFGPRFSFEEMADQKAVVAKVRAHGNAVPHMIGFVSAGKSGVISVKDPGTSTLSVATLQPVLDQVVKAGKIEIDYVHGDDVVCGVGSKHGNCGFVLPAMAKPDLFKAVVASGVVPRKTFSMGHAEEKRYYLEVRKIL